MPIVRGTRGEYCFFKTSRRPTLVRSLPCTALLKSSISSGGRRRGGGFDGLVVDEGSKGRSFEVAGAGRMVFCRLTGLSGMRGGSMRDP